MPKTPLIRLLLLIPLAWLATRAAADDAIFQGKDWAWLDTKPILAAAAGTTLAAYPNCDAVTLEDRTVEAYRADGTGGSQEETFTKVLTDKGRREQNVLRLDFLLPYFTVRVVRLELIKPDGTVVPINVAANAKESIDDSQMAENIYDPNSRILRVNIPGLAPGDVIHAVTRTTIRRPIIPHRFSDEFLFEGPEYIQHASCEIRAPAGDALVHVGLRDPVAGTATHTTRPGRDGTTVYDWEFQAVPRMYDEPAMPPPEMVLQRLLVSTIPDWRAVSRWYWNLSQSHLAAVSPDMKRTVAELTAGATTDEEKVRAIFFYVSRTIRYMGVTPEKDRPGFEPHDVQLTFAKKYGVCRDKAALLVAMLQMAGEKAYPVLINVGTRLDPQVPSPDFNHAIAAVELSPGHYQLMDPTDEHTRVLLPAYDGNQSYLVCRPEGDDLRTSPVAPPDRNMMRIRTVAALAADGTLTATAQLAFAGVNDDEYRGAFAEMKPDDRRRFFESRLQRAIPGARLTSLELSPTNMLDQSSPLRASITFSARAMAAFGPHDAVVTVPWIGRDFGVVNFVLDGTGLAKRKYPMEVDVTCGIDEEVALKLADNYARVVSVPSPTAVDDDGETYRRQFGIKGDTLHCSKLLALKVVEYSPAQYLKLKQTLKDLNYDERKAPVVALRGPAPVPAVAAAGSGPEAAVGSNAEVLQDDQRLTVTDAHTGVLRVHYVKKVLTYAGKIRESEVKIPYNPAMESVRLIHAVVTSPTGRRQEGSRDEVNVMDAGWNASAKRYPGGKIFVDSLPGVEVGSTIDVEFELAEHDKPFLAGFQSFQLGDALDEKSFRLTVPAGLPVQTHESGAPGIITAEQRVAGGNRVYEWRAGHVGALPDEPGLPPPWLYQAGIEYAVGDRAAYAAEVNRTMRGRAGKAAAAAAVARHLAAGAGRPEATVKAIRDFVAENVRQAGPGFTELPLSELSAADTTLAEGYGDLADRAILLDAMLRATGFHPEFVLASDLPPLARVTGVAQAVPLFEAFNFPLVRVPVGKAVYYLNDTDQYAQLGSTGHDDRLGLVLDRDATETIAALPDCHTGTQTSYSLTLADDGNARIGIRREFSGMAFAEENRRITELRPEERDRFFEEEVSGVAQGARPQGGLTTDFSGYPGVEKFTVEIDRYGIADGRFFYFNLPFTPRLFPTGADRRTLPLYDGVDRDDEIRAEIRLPAGFPLLAIGPGGASLAGPDDSGGVRIVASHGHGDYAIRYRLDRHPAIISPEDYPAAETLESDLENRASRLLLLESAAPAVPGT